MKTTNRYYVLAVATITGVLTGTSLVFSVFRNPLMAAHSWDASQVTLAYSGFMLMVLAGTFLGGPVQRRFKPSLILFVGGLMQGLGFFLTGCINTLPLLYICYSLMAGLGNGFLYGTAVGVVTKWFPDKPGFANGVCLGCMALSPLLFAPLANKLIEMFDVFASFKIMGGIMIVFFGVFSWLLKAPPPGWKPEGWEPVKSEKSNFGRDYSVKEMLSTPAYWLLLVSFTCCVLSGVMMTGQISAIAQQQVSITPAQGALMTGLLALFSFVGRMGLSTLSDKVGRFNMYLIVAAITALDCLLFFNRTGSFASFMIALFFIACSNGAMMAMLPGLVSDTFGHNVFSVNYPFLYCGYTISSFIGPLLASRNFESTGNYHQAVITVGIIAAVGFVGMILCKRKLDTKAAKV